MPNVRWRTILALALAALALAACSRAPVFDGVTTVKRGDVVVSIAADGDVALSTRESLGFGIAGTVAEVLVVEGDAVTAGQVLARLDPAALEVALIKAQAAAATAEDALEQLLEPPTPLEVELAIAAIDEAGEALADAEADLAAVGPKQVKAVDDAAVKLAAASADYSLLFRRYYGFEPDADEITDAPDVIFARRGNPDVLEFWKTFFPLQLQADNVATELDLAWNAARDTDLGHQAALLEQGKAATTAAKAVTKAKAAVQATRDALDALEADPDPTAVLAKEAIIASSALVLRDAKANLTKITLVAPIDGVVTVLAIEAGDTVTATASVLTILDPTALEVTAFVDELDVLRVRQGQLAAITLAAAPMDSVTGRVEEVGLLSVTQVGIVRYPVTIAVDPSALLAFRDGMSVSVAIEIERKENVLVVPVGALRTDGTRQAVQIVADDGLTDRRFVDVGAVDAFFAEITRGLPEGVLVVDFSVTVGQSEFLIRGRAPR